MVAITNLFKYDSVYGVYKGEVSSDGNQLIINDKKILFLSEKDPEQLPWKDLIIDVTIECTGFFTKKEDAEKHIHAGAKHVVISDITAQILFYISVSVLSAK